MDKKEADITVIEVDEENRGNEAGKLGGLHLYCIGDQKTEARLDEDDSMDVIKDEGESRKPVDQSESASIVISPKSKEQKHEKEDENVANYSNASGSGIQKDKGEERNNRNENPKNKRISKIQESERKGRQLRRTSSFIRSTNASNFKQSLRYSLDVVVWIFYHSVVLAIIPAIILITTNGMPWFFPINKENIKIYYVSTASLYVICLYATTSGLAIYAFGKQRVIRLFYKLATPFCLVHICIVAFGISMEISFIIFGSYLTFFSFVYLLMKQISTPANHPQANPGEVPNRYYILASDGTPMAVVKGLVPSLMMYFLSTYYIVPYCMDSGIFVRIIGRILVLPILFSVADAYMNNQIMQKSAEYFKYTMTFGTLTSLIFLAVLRFIISYSPSVHDTFLISLPSGVFEVILWSSHIPRSIYTLKIMGYLKRRMSFSICRNKRINNLNGVFPQPPNANERNYPQPNHDGIAGIEKIELSVEGFKRLFSQLNQEDSITRYVISHRTNRSIVMCMSEIQFIIFLPVVLYLCNPIKEYVSFQPTKTVTQLFASIFIQLPIELLTQIASLCLENYLYGIQVPVEKSLKHNLKPLIMLQYVLISLTVIYLSTIVFWIPVEKWPES